MRAKEFMESKPPTIVSSTTAKGIDRKKANRMVDPKGYFHPKMPMAEDTQTVPDIGALVAVDGVPSGMRVVGWLIGAEGAYVWCKRPVAEFLAVTSGAGTDVRAVPVSGSRVVGRVNWTPDHIMDAKLQQAARVGHKF